MEKNDLLRQQNFTLENKIEDKTREITKFENEIEFANSNITEYQKLYDSSANSVDDLREKEKNEINRKIEEAKKDIIINKKLIEETKLMVENIKNKGIDLKAKEVKVENSTCPTCSQSLPEEMIKESLKNAENEKQKQLLSIKEDYDSKKLLLSNLEQDLVANKDGLKRVGKTIKRS